MPESTEAITSAALRGSISHHEREGVVKDVLHHRFPDGADHRHHAPYGRGEARYQHCENLLPC